MSVAVLALSALVVGACDWPPQDYGDPGPPPMIFDSLPASSAYKFAKILIATANGSELHLDGTIAHFRQGPPTDSSGKIGYTPAGALGLANLSVLPRTISEFEWLGTLTLSHTNVADLTPISTLEYLEVLDLSNTKVSDLSPLAGLRSIKTLDLSDTPVTDLHPWLRCMT